MAIASIDCPILADALPTLNISRTQCCSTDFNDPVSCRNRRLVKVDFRNCAVNGPLSPLLLKLTALTDLSLAGNELAGPLPSSLERLRNLEQLDLRMNSISGEIPSIPTSSRLGLLDLSNNLLTGTIPPSLATLPRIDRLRLNGNRLYGPIPAEFGFDRSYVFFELFGGNCIDEKDLMNAITRTSVVQKSNVECQLFYRALPQPSGLFETTTLPTLFTSTSIPASSFPSSSPSPISTITAITISSLVLFFIIAIAAGLIVYRRRRNSSLVDAQAEPPSSIAAEFIPPSNIQPQPATRLPPGSTSNRKKLNSSFFSFDPNLAEESRDEFTPSAHLHGDDPNSIINMTDSKDIVTTKMSSIMDDNDEADDKQGNLFEATTFTPISNKAIEAGMILSAVEPAIQQSSTDLVMTNAASWSCEEVSMFLVKCGFDESVVDTFEDAKVDGQKILILTDTELVEMKIREENTRVLVRFAIDRLKFIQGRGDSSKAPGDLVGAFMPPEYS
ncbi:hypothetical protein BC829DRAFT_439737 [Chytridium lagenaria]|nr:hypothetical protein BC829DRAFT_439737 [Chytridium lagenaria]